MRSTCSITEAAERLQVSVRAIRFYEEKGLVRPQRNGKARIYAETDIRNLRFVIEARGWRFSLAEIASVMAQSTVAKAPAFPADLIRAQRSRLAEERAELDGIIRRLDAALAMSSRGGVPGTAWS